MILFTSKTDARGTLLRPLGSINPLESYLISVVVEGEGNTLLVVKLGQREKK